MRLAIIVLAAGRSRRFGSRDKLRVPLEGRPVAQHVVRLLRGQPSAIRIVVLRDRRLAGMFRGFRVVRIDRAAQGLSLAAGLRAAKRAGASHALVLLADMPRVARADLRRILHGALTHPAMARAKTPMPPALIPRHLFPLALANRRDQGAGAILRQRPDLILHELAEAHLVDIDRPQDLVRLRPKAIAAGSAES